MESPDSRRMSLLLLVELAENVRAGIPPGNWWSKSLLQEIAAARCRKLGGQWTGKLDRRWAQRRLSEVAAAPGKTSLQDYFRWRTDGVPVWALVAANMCPLIDSREPFRDLD